MKLTVKNITQADAVEILCWKYDAPYDFYNAMLTPDALIKLLGPSYFAVKDETDELIGFFCIGKSATVEAGHQLGIYDEDCIDFGIGMKPELTGKGYGTQFFSFIVHFIEQRHPGIPLRLTVAIFNRRAIRLYENFGFVKQKTFTDEVELITMKKEKSL